MSLKLVMTDGVLAFECPLCDKLLEVGVHVRQAAAAETRKSPLTGTTYGHRVEFIAEAPNLHASFWGHVVREHDGVNPYMSGGSCDRCGGKHDVKGMKCPVVPDDGLSMWQQEYDRIQERNQ